ncbi:hypothetical protein G4B88_008302 [Cannabis sativa]|uniref:ATPase AAA-type core domain-containing protein n=1 Tax=Cannabis sativa TaxID=3483 RepID=A0A7J6FLS5_CANSA|nr:hypothetical protein G4B88_008302 [Cannabis sativa]
MLCEKEAENTPSYQFIPTTKLILPEMKSNLPKLGTIPVWYNENSSQILPPKIHQGRLGDASWTRSTPPLLSMVAYKLFDCGKHDQQASEVVTNKATTISDLGVVTRMLPAIHHDMELQHISFESVSSPSVPEKTHYTADNFRWPTMVKEEPSLLITKEPVPGASCLMTAYCRRQLENSKLSNCSFQPYQVRPNPLGYFLNLALMFSSFTRAIMSHQINHKPNSFNYIIDWAHLSKEYPRNGLVTWDPGETHLSILLGLDSTKQKQVLLEENPHVSFSYTLSCFLNVITSSSIHPWQKNIFQVFFWTSNLMVEMKSLQQLFQSHPILTEVLMREKKIWEGFHFDSGKSKTSLPCPYNFLNDFLSIFHSHNSYWSNVVRDQVVVGIMIAAGKKRPRLKFWYEVLCLIFIDKMNVVGSTQHQWEGYTKKMLHQLLVGMDDFEPHIGIILMAVTTLLDIFDPALTRPGRIVMYVVPISDGRGRPESLEFYLQDKSLVANIDVNGTIKFDLANLVNMETLKAAVEGVHKMTDPQLEFTKNKIIINKIGVTTVQWIYHRGRKIIFVELTHEENPIIIHEFFVSASSYFWDGYWRKHPLKKIHTEVALLKHIYPYWSLVYSSLGLSLLELVSGASFYGATLAFFPLTLHTKGGITNLLSWFFDRDYVPADKGGYLAGRLFKQCATGTSWATSADGASWATSVDGTSWATSVDGISFATSDGIPLATSSDGMSLATSTDGNSLVTLTDGTDDISFLTSVDGISLTTSFPLAISSDGISVLTSFDGISLAASFPLATSSDGFTWATSFSLAASSNVNCFTTSVS